MITKLFPEDVLDRARRITQSLASTGAYTHSQGIPAVREAVAKFIERRDGVPSDARHVFLTNGASDAVHRILNAIITTSDIGVFV